MSSLKAQLTVLVDELVQQSDDFDIAFSCKLASVKQAVGSGLSWTQAVHMNMQFFEIDESILTREDRIKLFVKKVLVQAMTKLINYDGLELDLRWGATTNPKKTFTKMNVDDLGPMLVDVFTNPSISNVAIVAKSYEAI